MEQFTEPVEGQHDGQETAADHPLPIKAERIHWDAPYSSHFVVQRLGLTIVCWLWSCRNTQVRAKTPPHLDPN